MSTTEQTLTISTRLRIDDPATGEIPSDLCTLYSTALYTAISRKNRKIPILKSDFMREFGLSSRNFNSVIRSADGMVKSVLSNMENYAQEHEAKAVQLNKLILKAQKKREDTVEKLKETVEKIGKTRTLLIEKTNSPSQQKMLEQLQEQHKTLKQKRERLNREIAQRARRRDRHYRMQDDIQQQVKDKHASMCFGSRKLFNAQHHLAANRFGDFDHWKRIWQKSRNNMFFSIGSKDETMGNQTCVLSRDGDEAYQLRVRLPHRLEAQHGASHVLLRDIRFAYRPELVENLFVSHQQRKEKEAELNKSQTNLKKAEFLAQFGQAVTYRLMRDEKGWILYLSTEQEFEEAEFDPSQGVIGLDFNNGFVSVANINAAGQKVETFDQRYDTTKKKSSKANDTAMQLLAIDLVSYARAAGKPLVIEDLDFAKKKAGLVNAKGTEQYHNMISQLSYKKFRQALKMQCLKQGVALKEVNPAYTSLVGRVKYARETRFSTHQAAAWCISLVGMGRKIERMRLPRRFVLKQNGFVLGLATPEDVVDATGSKKLSRLAKGMSKMVGDLVTERRDEVIARKRAKHEDRRLARLSPPPASNGGHWQVSNARSADDHIPY